MAAALPALYATPRLVITPQTAYTVPVVQGQNGSTITLQAGNAGDGSLSLQVSSSASFLVPTVGSAATCGFSQCTNIAIALQTASLAAGTYTGFVTVTSPGATDAPQTISVTVVVGGSIPNQITLYAAPGGTVTQSFVTGGNPSVTSSTTSGGNFLSVAVNGTGSFTFNVPYLITANAGTLAPGNYNGTIALSGSSFAPDNKNVAVTLDVTTSPILQVNPASQTFIIAQGAASQTNYSVLTNLGQGTLNATSATVATTSGGNFLTATIQNGNLLAITASSAGLSAGQYSGTVTVASNAANGSVTVPVTLLVQTAGAPAANAGGAVNNATFGAGEMLSPGDIVAIFGTQFTAGSPAGATMLPLMTNLSGTQVFVNGEASPVYYVSANQVDFQIPYDAKSGPGVVQVVSNGQAGNSIYVNIAAEEPRIYVVTDGSSGAVVGNSGSAVKAGTTLTIYGVGFGATSPAVTSGMASPSSPLANVPGQVKVCFGVVSPFSTPTCTNAQFAGLTPNYVGLYQVNVAVPSGLTGPFVPVEVVLPDGTVSNALNLYVQ